MTYPIILVQYADRHLDKRTQRNIAKAIHKNKDSIDALFCENITATDVPIYVSEIASQLTHPDYLLMLNTPIPIYGSENKLLHNMHTQLLVRLHELKERGEDPLIGPILQAQAALTLKQRNGSNAQAY
ncbi:MAG: hypothetical protein V1725_07740 [archaeon]